MTKALIRLFIKNAEDTRSAAVREQYGILSGAVGIACNLFLFALKLTIGLVTGAISIAADAFNNLSDGLSCMISIVGFKVANREPDEKHPFGYGRTEYIAGLIVSFIILLVGFEFFKTSLDRIIHPSAVAFSALLTGILAVSMLDHQPHQITGRAHLRRGHQPRPHRALDQSERGICHPAAAEAAAYAGPHGDRRAGQRIHDRRSLKGGDEMLSIFNGVRDITMLSVTVRLCLAVLCGGMIGLERAFKRRPAGFRTHILICLGASLTTMTSQYLYLNMHYFTDMARLGAQVVAGIGFIGAGTIIVTRRQRVKGLTTAAGLWTSAIVGLALGGGFYEGGIAVSVLVLLAELVFSRLEYRILDNVPEINLYMEYSDKDCLENVLQLLRQNRLSISNMEITRSAGSEEHNACAIFALHLKKGCRTEDLIQKIQRIEGVVSVEKI